MDGLKEIGEVRTYEYREKIAKINGIESYSGTREQNLYMLDLLQKGKLIKPQQ